MTCPLPSDVDFASASYVPGWSPRWRRGILTADLGPLAAGATAIVTVVLRSPGRRRGDAHDHLHDPGQNTDPVTTNNTAQRHGDRESGGRPAGHDLPGTQRSRPQSRPSGLTRSPSPTWDYPMPRRDGDGSLARGRSVCFGGIESGFDVPSYSDGDAPGRSGRDRRGRDSATVSVGRHAHEPSGSLSLSASGRRRAIRSRSWEQLRLRPTVSVAPSVNLAVALGPSSQTVVTGQPVTMTASVENTGPNPATSVCSDPPDGLEPSSLIRPT